MDRINLAQDTDKCQAVVNTVMNVWVLFVPTVLYSSVSTISGNRYTECHMLLHSNVPPPVLSYVQQIENCLVIVSHEEELMLSLMMDRWGPNWCEFNVSNIIVVN